MEQPLHQNEAETVSVVMPAYNEEQSVGEVVLSFLEKEVVSEVVIADNNSTDRTAEIARSKGARVVAEDRQGYGYAMKKALESAESDIVVSVEPDKSYSADDLEKFLSYYSDFNAVFGDRTNKAMIREGAKMNPFLRFGNKFLGRLIELIFNGPRITDVGCSYRLFDSQVLEKLLEEDVRGPDLYSPQLIINCLERDIRFVQIPVNYLEREGESKLTNSFVSSTLIGLKMLKYIARESTVGKK